MVENFFVKIAFTLAALVTVALMLARPAAILFLLWLAYRLTTGLVS